MDRARGLKWYLNQFSGMEYHMDPFTPGISASFHLLRQAIQGYHMELASTRMSLRNLEWLPCPNKYRTPEHVVFSGSHTSSDAIFPFFDSSSLSTCLTGRFLYPLFVGKVQKLKEFENWIMFCMFANELCSRILVMSLYITVTIHTWLCFPKTRKLVVDKIRVQNRDKSAWGGIKISEVSMNGACGLYMFCRFAPICVVICTACTYVDALVCSCSC